jgi:hypothetical protein
MDCIAPILKDGNLQPIVIDDPDSEVELLKSLLLSRGYVDSKY